MWIVLFIIALILLVVSFFRRSNAIWGGATIGSLIGIVIAIVNAIMGNGFQWSLIYKSVIIATLIGGVAELLPRIVKRR